MGEMIEKCARAIYEATPRNKPWELLGQHQRQYEKKAAAVIDALMEPTEGMVEACWPLHHPWGQNAPAPADRPQAYEQMRAKVAADFRAMLSKAKSE